MLKTTKIFSLSQVLRVRIWELPSWVGPAQGLSVKQLAQGYRICRPGWVAPRWLAPMAVGRRPQFLAMWTYPQSCLSVLRTWQLAPPRVTQERAKEEGVAVPFMA